MTIYLISGLGADKRAFQKLVFPDNFEVINIEWLIPIKQESLNNYALRISKQINTNKPFILVGLSFGGIIVTELNRIIKPVKSFIISSIQNKKEIPAFLRLLGTFKIHRIIPTKFLNRTNFVLYWFFGIENDLDKKLLSQILHDTDVQFLKWAINAILSWKQEPTQLNIYHIHGTKDKMLPIRFVKPNIKIEEGGHFMIYSMADKINLIFDKEIGSL